MKPGVLAIAFHGLSRTPRGVRFAYFRLQVSHRFDASLPPFTPVLTFMASPWGECPGGNC